MHEAEESNAGSLGCTDAATEFGTGAVARAAGIAELELMDAEGDAPTTAFDPATEMDPPELATTAADAAESTAVCEETAVVEAAPAPPDGAAVGVAAVPIGASAAEPNMRSITTTASTVTPKGAFMDTRTTSGSPT